MAEIRFDQFSFAVGEIDPKTQSAVQWDGYYKALKYARNVQIIPQGGIQRRWGTKYVDSCTVGDASVPAQFELCTLLYDADPIYLIVWEPLSAKIYLQNKLVATVVTTYAAEDIIALRFAQVENRLIITNVNFKPRQLVRSANSANVITGIDTTNNYINITTALTAGNVYPVQFTTSGSLPTTTPQIYVGRTYFINAITTNSVRVYATSQDAIDNVNYFTIATVGTGTNNVITYNTWSLSDIIFINVPAYDYDGGYSAITFTPSATSGTAVVITLSAPLANLTSATFVGGLFTGNGGSLRITSVADTSHFTGYTVHSFIDTSAIEGAIAFLGEPVWSDVRGWPKYPSFFQNRLVFAGSISLPNGVWLSVVNQAYNFDDSQALDDDAIRWYPAGGSINLIVGVTSARSLLIHTNNGTFSTPLLNEAPVTPTNFTLTEQNKFSVQPIQPIFIDNQIIFVDTASNVINMIWDITQSAFKTNTISVASSSLITNPVDMASFYEPKATDGFYALFVNADGTLAVYQTLYEQQIGAWSLMNTVTNVVADQVNNYTTVQSSYIHVISGYNRCWFLVQRKIPTAQAGVTITAIDAVFDTFTAASHGLTQNASNLITFITTGLLPTTSPQINTTEYWWARGLDANTFAVYTNDADASADLNRVTVTALGANSKVVYWPNTNKVYIEELSFDVLTDCATNTTLTSSSATVTGLSYLNGTVVNVKGDGYVLTDTTVFAGSITNADSYTTYEVGENYISRITPLAVSIPGVFGVLYKPKHVRTLYVRYYQSIGFKVLQGNVPIIDMQQQVLGTVPQPQSGVYEATPMEGWNDFDFTDGAEINIIQSNPLPMTILGLSYVLEVS